MSLVFVDVETSGLSAVLHEVVELAWAVDDGPVHVLRLRHTLRFFQPKALEVNGYHRRGLGDPSLWADPDRVSRFILDARGSTLVAANPSFDAGFLAARFEHAPWKYRLLDIQVYAQAVFDWDEPRSLRDVRAELVARGHRVDAPDHTAGNDVVTLRQAYWALRAERAALRPVVEVAGGG